HARARRHARAHSRGAHGPTPSRRGRPAAGRAGGGLARCLAPGGGGTLPGHRRPPRRRAREARPPGALSPVAKPRGVTRSSTLSSLTTARIPHRLAPAAAECPRIHVRLVSRDDGWSDPLRALPVPECRARDVLRAVWSTTPSNVPQVWGAPVSFGEVLRRMRDGPGGVWKLARTPDIARC